MGLLENFRPKLVPGKINKEPSPSFEPREGPVYHLLDSAEAFLKYCNGSFSCAEIISLLYKKGIPFKFKAIRQSLLDMDAEGLWVDSPDIFKESKDTQLASKTAAGPKPIPKVRREQLPLYLMKMSLFKGLDESTLNSIAKLCEVIEFSPGEPIIRRGSQGTEAYALLHGKAIVTSVYKNLETSKVLATLPPLTVFGESAAVVAKTRTADVVASEKSIAIKFDVKRILEPTGSQRVNKNLKIRLVLSQILKTHPFFKDLPGELTHLFMSCCSIHRMGPEKVVVQQGDDGEDFFFIVSGSAVVLKNGLPEAKLKSGSYFGEIAVLQRTPRTATVMTDSDCLLLKIKGQQFIQLLSQNLVLAEMIEDVAWQRQGVTADVNVLQAAIDIKEVTFIDEEITQVMGGTQDWDFSQMEE